MAATKICKVCGKEYECCRTNRVTDVFRWRDVACSPEHGSEYFARVMAVRAKETAEVVTLDVTDAETGLFDEKVNDIPDDDYDDEEDYEDDGYENEDEDE